MRTHLAPGDETPRGVVVRIYHVHGIPWAGLPPCDIAIIRRPDGSRARYFADDLTGPALFVDPPEEEEA